MRGMCFDTTVLPVQIKFSLRDNIKAVLAVPN